MARRSERVGPPPRFPDYDELDPRLADAVRSVMNQHELDTDVLPQSIAVVAAMHGEGVTTIAQALSLLIANEMAATVCLVDCSWMAETRPSNIEHPLGMFELMTDQCSVGDALQPVGSDARLMTLGSGNVPANRRHVLARSTQFERLMQLLAEELDHVVFDTPPMLQGAAGLAVLRHADAHLLVVRHGVTTLAQVRSVREKIGSVPQLGTVLNQYHSSVPASLHRLLAR